MRRIYNEKRTIMRSATVFCSIIYDNCCAVNIFYPCFYVCSQNFLNNKISKTLFLHFFVRYKKKTAHGRLFFCFFACICFGNSFR